MLTSRVERTFGDPVRTAPEGGEKVFDAQFPTMTRTELNAGALLMKKDHPVTKVVLSLRSTSDLPACDGAQSVNR